MNQLRYRGLDIDPSKLTETIQVSGPSGSGLSLKESDSGEAYVMPRIESIHVGKTANSIYYPADKLRGDKSLGSGVYSWTEPYAKPVIYNHDLNTEVTGRIVRAAYSEYTSAGRPGIFVVPKITEPNAVQAVRDGRLLTVSIGATTDQAICSICGTDIINEGYCGHMKGEEYDGEEAHWITGNLYFQELSWVNQPADSNAFVIDTDTSEQSVMSDTEESVHNKNIHAYYGVPNAVPLVEAVSNKEEKEGITEVSKPIDRLKENTKNAKNFLEAVDIDLAPVEVVPGETVELTYSGDRIPSGASVSVDHEYLSVELGDNQELLLTADENAPEEDVTLTISVTVDGAISQSTVDVAIGGVAEDEEDPEEDETPEDNTPPEEEPEEDPEGDDTPPADEPEEDPEEDPAPEEDPVPEDPEDSGESEEPADDEVTEAIERAADVIEELQGANDVLRAENKVLVKELKERYIDKIKSEQDGNLSEEYIEKLKGRNINSLRETVEDIESGFLTFDTSASEPSPSKRRVVKPVENPIKESEEPTNKGETTEEEKLSALKQLFSY